MKLRINRQAKGFTLIEILVVIAILAALTAISWVAFGAVQS
ncbi:MAG: prepilin-type N-terminal cleavage/methylation domain-containing protein [Akkermansia sp.]|nr:prepilin-type N-terminal cleavage/methylation domain-containing protein [Akkermansia sp.]